MCGCDGAASCSCLVTIMIATVMAYHSFVVEYFLIYSLGGCRVVSFQVLCIYIDSTSISIHWYYVKDRDTGRLGSASAVGTGSSTPTNK